MDLIIRKATELGVTAIRPCESARSITLEERDASQHKSHRWPAVLEKAVEQCRRRLVPELHETSSLVERPRGRFVSGRAATPLREGNDHRSPRTEGREAFIRGPGLWTRGRFHGKTRRVSRRVSSTRPVRPSADGSFAARPPPSRPCPSFNSCGGSVTARHRHRCRPPYSSLNFPDARVIAAGLTFQLLSKTRTLPSLEADADVAETARYIRPPLLDHDAQSPAHLYLLWTT